MKRYPGAVSPSTAPVNTNGPRWPMYCPDGPRRPFTAPTAPDEFFNLSICKKNFFADIINNYDNNNKIEFYFFLIINYLLNLQTVVASNHDLKKVFSVYI